MRLWRHTLYGIATACAVVTSAACASVPKEVVELSYRMGQDLEGVHTSYIALVHDHFDRLRQARLDYVEKEWAPVMIRGFIDDGQLVQMAKGTVVFSGGNFIAPDPANKETQLLDSVGTWARSAVRKIEAKKTSLIDPLNTQEVALSKAVNDAFDQLNRGNSTITAHLNSLRKVQEVQDDALSALHLKDLRDTINNKLVQVSDLAAKELDDVRKVDKVVKQGETLIGQ
jgi:hypothetical protein